MMKSVTVVADFFKILIKVKKSSEKIIDLF